jgi:hypothetical protein
VKKFHIPKPVVKSEGKYVDQAHHWSAPSVAPVMADPSNASVRSPWPLPATWLSPASTSMRAAYWPWRGAPPATLVTIVARDGSFV